MRRHLCNPTNRKTSWSSCFALWLLVCSAALFAPAEGHAQTVQHLAQPYFGWYAKLVDCDGIAVRGSAAVDDKALILGCQKLQRMTARNRAVHANLVNQGLELHLIGQHELVSDLPEDGAGKHGTTAVSAWGKQYPLDTERGLCSYPYCNCAEEIMLELSSSGYSNGTDICGHELGHAVMDLGTGPQIQQAIKDRYTAAMKEGRWTTVYASHNQQEFFAVMTMWYFGGHGQFIRPNFPAPGPEGLRSYDPETYALLDKIYSGAWQPVLYDMQLVHPAGTFSRSGSNSQIAQLRFDNHTPGSLNIFWIDGSGAEKPFGTIAPYNHLDQQTYVGHVWLVKDSSGKKIARFSVPSPHARAILGPRQQGDLTP
jgi:hypothetical protein